MLAPKSSQPNSDDIGDEYGLEIVNDNDNGLDLDDGNSESDQARITPASASASRSSRQKKSRRELYEEAQRKQAAKESGTVYRPEATNDDPPQSNFPSFDTGSLIGAAVEMIKSKGVMWRVLIAVILMCVGTIMMQWFFPDSAPKVEEGKEGTMMERLGVWLAWGIVGGVPYLLGVAMLWLTSAYIYRDAALGHRTVKTWKNAGTSEVTGTLLIFGFGFFIGGLPALFLTLLTMPLRVLFGPLLLLGAWYGQSPFSIVNVDAFRGVNKNMGHWIAFYRFMFLLAGISILAGLVFWLRAIIPVGPAFVLTAIVSIVGVLILTVVTLVFAAVCGWHCGKVVEGLQE